MGLLGILLIALLCPSLQSQPPSPTPGKTRQDIKGKTAREKDVAADNQSDVDAISTAINKLTSEIASWKQQQTGAPHKDEPPADWWLRWSTIISAIVSTAATVAIAILAYYQWRRMGAHEAALNAMAGHMSSGLTQANYTAAAATSSANSAHQSVVLSNRPRLVVRRIGVRGENGATIFPDEVTRGFHSIFFEVSNSGNQPADVMSYFCFHLVGERLPLEAPFESEETDKTEFTLQPGVIKLCDSRDPLARQIQRTSRINEGWEHLWIIGWVNYKDGLGNVRRTAFCRKWSKETQRFVPTNDPDYEYAD